MLNEKDEKNMSSSTNEQFEEISGIQSTSIPIRPSFPESGELTDDKREDNGLDDPLFSSSSANTKDNGQTKQTGSSGNLRTGSGNVKAKDDKVIRAGMASLGLTPTPTSAMTLNQVIQEVTEAYANVTLFDTKSPSDIESEVVSYVHDRIKQVNDDLDKGDKLRAPQKLCVSQVATLMLHMYPIIRVKCGGTNADPSYDLLAIYQDDGPDAGTYVTDDDVFKKLAKQLNYSMLPKELSDVVEMLTLEAPRKFRTVDKDLIAVNNGIFDFKTKTLIPFSQDYIFLSKSKVNYNAAAVNVIIHNDVDHTDWDVDSWMNELSDDPEVVDVLWQILSAIIRPHVRWNKSAWLYSTQGNNGKGTLCELMRSLVGDGSYAAILLHAFSEHFALEPLIRASAIIVDENNVGQFVDKAANLKAVITNDVIPINRKFKTTISYQFYGFMVQCLNDYPRVKDRSDSFYRRQLFVPFMKCFTGREKAYIKTDYLHRKEVLEYVLYKVLNMNFYTLSEPESCKLALEEYKEYNDPVRQFLDEILPQFVWDFVPFSFMYDLYKAWSLKNSPGGSLYGRNTYIIDVINLLPQYKGWYCQGRQIPVRPGKMMDKPEPLIAAYDLKDWKNPNYTGHDINRICMPELKSTYNGLRRMVVDNVSDVCDDTDAKTTS